MKQLEVAIRGRHEAAQATIEQLERGIEQQEAEIGRLEKDLGVVAGERDEWRGHAERFRHLLSKRRFLRKDLRQAIQEFPKPSDPRA